MYDLDVRRDGGRLFARVDDREYEIEASQPEPGCDASISYSRSSTRAKRRPPSRRTSRSYISPPNSALIFTCYAAAEPPLPVLLGWGVTRRYGLTVFQPPGNFSFASSSESDG